MNRCFASVLAAVATAVATSVSTFAGAAECTASGSPVPFTAHYDVSASRGMLALEGEATIALIRNGNDYAVTASLSASGLMSSKQESRGMIGDGILIPARYSESSSRRGAASTTIDWRERRVVFVDGSDAPARATLQDRASLMVQLALALRAKPDAAAFEFPVASLRRISTFKFVRRAKEKLDLPAGVIDTERFERIDEDGDDRLDVWLAPSKCGLPVRIRLRDQKGLDVDQRLRELRIE